jgi:hypothetical protein
MNKEDRFIFRLGFAGMIALLLLSVIYWRERTLFLDVAYQTVLMLRDGDVQVQVQRFGAAVVQALPLWGSKLMLPLKGVLLLYSVSFTLLYLLFFTLTAFVFKDRLMSWAMLCLYLLMTVDGFYWCTSELQQGLGFMLVVWAFIRRFPAIDRGWHMLFLLPALVAVVFYHPLLVLPWSFLAVFFVWKNPALRHWRYGMVQLVYLGIIVLKQVYLPNWYDSGKMSVFMQNLQEDFPNYFSYPAYSKFFNHLWHYWWGVLLLYVAFLLGSIRKRAWADIVFVTLAVVGYVVISALGSPNASYRFYAEVNYMPIIPIVAIPAGAQLLDDWLKLRWVRLVMVTVLTARLLHISAGHEPFAARLDWLSQAMKNGKMEKPDVRKFYLTEQQSPMDTLFMTWATPYETLLLTACEMPDSASSLMITPDTSKFSADWQREDVFISEFQTFALKKLPDYYFGTLPGIYHPLY